MIKIMCPSCDEILEVDESLEKIYCSKCFKNISIEQGKKYLSSYVSKHTSLGLKYLNEATEYKKAHDEFLKVIKITPEDASIASNLVKSTLLMSTIRENYIAESMDYLNQYYETLQRDILFTKECTHFIEEINEYLNVYIKTLEDRLMNEDTFYEVEGKKLYLDAVKKVKDYKQRIIDLYFINRKFPTKSNLSISRLEKDIVLLSQKENKRYGVQSSPFHLLNTDVKECYINDQIFLDNRKLYHNMNKVVVWGIIFLALLLIGTVLIFIFPKKLLLGVPIAIIGFVGAIIMLIVRIFIQRKLK